MKPWIIIACLSLFLITALAACSAPSGEPEAQLPTVSAFTWETYSDAAGSFTMDIPDYLPLESVEVDEDGKSSLTMWGLRNGGDTVFHVVVVAQYNKTGWDFTSEERSKNNFAHLNALYERQVGVRYIEPPHPIRDGWAYTVEVDAYEGKHCRVRSTEYFDAKTGWAYLAAANICVGENITYYLDGRKAIFSLTPTP